MQTVRQDGSDGLEKLNKISEGDFFGYETFMAQQSSDPVDQEQQRQQQTGVRALTDSSMYLLSETNMLLLVSMHPISATCALSALTVDNQHEHL